MFEHIHRVFYNSSEDRHSEHEIHTTLTSCDERLVTWLRDTVQDQNPVVVVNAKAQLPQYWQQRLLQPLFEQTDVQRISALSLTTPDLSPLIRPWPGTLTELDQLLYVMQDPTYFATESFNKNCFAVRNVSLLTDAALEASFAVNNLLVDVPTDEDRLNPATPHDVGDQHPLPAHPLATVQTQLANQLEPLPTTAANHYPGLDGREAILHVVMDWGGGVHQWVNEFIANHPELNHWVWVSEGEFYRQCHGERLSLRWQHCQGVEVASTHLAAPIKATEVHHPEYQRALQQLIEQHHIKGLVVSSMIGHAMDCLDTGLPTVRVLHDYFPHWPSLNAQLDAPKITAEHTEQALVQTAQEPFGVITSAQLSTWQQTNNKHLAQENVTLVAPDESVKANLLKLPHSQCYEKTTTIPHAFEPLKPINYQADGQPFHVLVPGRVSQPKGGDLLFQAINACKGINIKWTLLGAGKDGDRFKSLKQVTVIADYDRDELHQQLQQLKPHLGLITSTTSETFSFTLSELQSAGIPVLATDVGALSHRIQNGVNGQLVKPEVAAIVSGIEQLMADRSQLEQLHTGALNSKHHSKKAYKQAFQQVFAPKQSKPPSYQNIPLAKPNHWAQKIQLLWQVQSQLEQTCRHYEQDITELKADAKNKAEWAASLNQQNQHLTENLALQKQQIKQLEIDKTAQAKTYEGEISKLNSSLTELQEHLEKLNQEITHLRGVEQQLQAAEQTIEAMKNSRSWRVTRPLRAFTTYARHKRNAARFRWTQLKSLPRRVSNSLRSRGLKETAKIAKNKLHKPTNKTQLEPQQVTENYQPLTIQTAEQPKVSVIIPVYNQFKHTYHCLKSLSRLNDQTPFEVIVVDDCSDDVTPDAIQQVSGIHYQRQAKNGGFIESCNTGAALAQGEYLLFLNNDTEVLNGWLDELLETFNKHPDAGLVGSQLLYPDGRLQEAGGIVFSDGSGWNYGRLEKPDAPEYQHLRAVTYISGASIMISKQLFTQLGQFDRRYKPAYYEDTDLAFAVRQAGLQVYYQPLSRVIHFEGISSGTDLSSGTKKYQVINQTKFVDKWQSALSKQPKPGSDIELARFQNQAPRVLILDACTPTPDQDSGSLRMLNLMQILLELGHEVSFMPENMAHFENYTTALQRLGVKCIYAPKYHSPLEYLKANGGYYQTVILSRYYVAEPIMPSIRNYCPQATIWFDTVDLHYVRETRMAELAGDQQATKAAAVTRTKELAVARGCDLTLVVSPYEQEVLAAEDPNLPVAVLSNIHEVYGTKNGFDQRRDIVFLGGYQHTPNVDGILWFVEAIWPTILAAIPDIQLHVVGSKAPSQVTDLGKQDNIQFHGFVEDIEPFMQKVRIAVAPLRFGAGVKGKVNMSMSHGQPVVGTKVAVEGMYTTHEMDVMMADEADDFAQAVIRLYQNPDLWQRISTGGLANVEQWFSFAAAKNTINNLINTAD